MNLKIVALLATSLLFVACSSKSQFEPKHVGETLNFSQSMSASLQDVAREGATYHDGMVLTKKRGLLTHKLDKGNRFVYDEGRHILVASADGLVRVRSGEKVLFEKRFGSPLASGTIHDDILALILANNTLILYDYKQKKELYKEALEPTFANDARLANPIFMDNMVIFPTLDGRLYIIDKVQKRLIRDIAVSSRELFNNIIFLEKQGDNLVAATASKVLLVSSSGVLEKRMDVKDVLLDKDRIYLFSKTGRVIKTDFKLKVLAETKFPMARFSTIMMDDKLYMVEKSGYLIMLDKDLKSKTVYRLPSEIDSPVFAFKKRLFVGSHFLKLR